MQRSAREMANFEVRWESELGNSDERRPSVRQTAKLLTCQVAVAESRHSGSKIAQDNLNSEKAKDRNGDEE